MATQHEIILIDGGDDVGPVAPRPSSEPAAAPRSGDSGPKESGTRPAKRQDESKAGEGAALLASTLAKVLGGGGLVTVSAQLAKTFNDIIKSAEQLSGGKPAGPAPAGPSSAPAPAPPTVPGTTPAAAGAGVSPKPTANVNITPAVSGPPAGGATAAEGMNALAGVARAAGPAAIAIGGFAVAVGAGTMAVKGLFDTLSNEVKRLEGVSADVSVAASMTDVRRELADLRRADKIGPDLARFENTRSKFEDKLSDAWTEILKVLLRIFETIEPAVKLGTDFVGLFAAALDQVLAAIDTVRAAMTWDGEDDKKAAAALTNASERLTQALESFGRDKEEDDPEDPFMKLLLGQFQVGGQL